MKINLTQLAKRVALLLSALVLSVPFVTSAQTPVLFPMTGLTGQANNRTILIQPDRSPNLVNFGTNLVPSYDFTIQPIGGQVITNLIPWGYTIRVDGWPRSVHIVVPTVATGSAALNVVSLINTNQFAPLNFYVTLERSRCRSCRARWSQMFIPTSSRTTSIGWLLATRRMLQDQPCRA